MASPQKENGYTPVANEVLERIAFAELSGREFRVLLVIIRKTWGWGKKEDRISLGQIAEATGLERSHTSVIVSELTKRKFLFVKGATKVGNTPNTIRFNKNYEEWGAKGVTKNGTATKKGVTAKGSRVLPKKVAQVLPPKVAKVLPKTVHTKESKESKETLTKESTQSVGTLGNEVINVFQLLNPSYKQLFKRKPQHDAAERLVEQHGFEMVKRVVAFVQQRRDDRFCPTITTPIQLEEKWGALESYAAKLKSKTTGKKIIGLDDDDHA